MKIHRIHPWQIPLEDAARLQNELAARLQEEPLDAERVRFVAGADVSYEQASDTMFAAVVVVNYLGLDVVEEATAVKTTRFPYIPGFLSFREGPALLAAFEKLRQVPDLVLFDGQGIAHPRGMGVASHLGLFLDLPSIGCAKSVLVGSYSTPGTERGSTSALIYRGRQVGAVVRTRTGVSPVIVSVGHRADLAGAIEVVLRLAPRFRIPEPIRRAHILANKTRAGLSE